MSGTHETASVAPLPAGASAAEIDAYVAAVKALPETQPHPIESGKVDEHLAAMNLVSRDEATHVAISDGDWFDPATWDTGEIPGDDARVLIPEGIHVGYGEVSDTRLFTLRIDGTLDFETDTDSRMVFDTMVVGIPGELIIGTEDDPVDVGASVELIIANNGPIDTDWDPLLLSRGIVSHGDASIRGTVKDSHEKVVTDPMAGDTSLTFETLPEGWQVGDTLVVAGTRFEGYKWDNDIRDERLYENEDEERTIVAIEDNRIILDKPLEFDHDAPRDDLKTSVANMTRNVSIETENGETAEVYERGHVMFMHSDNVDVRYAEFKDLGRTDKSVPSFDISDIDDVGFDSNVQGRYSLHLHRTGVSDPDDPTMVVGNAVSGSPGWGYVHHDSNAILENNASFDTFGAGYVAETGNEIGAWNDNIAIYAPGVGWGQPKWFTDIEDGQFDTGRSGDGFWFQGRMVDSTNNIAASVNNGFVYFHRNGDDRMIDFDSANFEYPDVFYGDDEVFPGKAPILSFQGNETFAAREGLHVVKAGGAQGHDVWTKIDDFTAWSVRSGVHLQYTTKYLLTDIDVIGKDPTQYNPPRYGIELSKGSADIVVIDARIDGFTNGIEFNNNAAVLPPELTNYVIIDPTIINTDTDFLSSDPTISTVITTRDALEGQAPDLQLDPLAFVGKTVLVSGTKTDGLGSTDFPSETDDITLYQRHVVNVLEDKGYWTTSDGDAYFLLDVYFSDRLTGEVYYETAPVALSPETVAKFGQTSWDYENVELNGTRDIPAENPVHRAGDIIIGTEDGDMIVGADFDNIILGKGGDDTLLGEAGDDDIFGGFGDDDIFGGTGEDQLFGRRGDDTLEGGTGGDILRGGKGSDMLKGGDGSDTLKGGKGGDAIFGGAGEDQLYGKLGDDALEGGELGDTLNGGKGDDTLKGGEGEDLYVFIGEDFGTDTIIGFEDDRIKIISPDEATSEAELMAALSDQDGNAVYDYEGDGRNVIIFEDVAVADLDLAYFDMG